MLSIDKIEESIIELEQKDTSFSVCEKLAQLYIVHDHLKGYSVSPEATIAAAGSSEFLRAINGKNPENIWPIMDELMETVMVLHPKTYEAVMERIQQA